MKRIIFRFWLVHIFISIVLLVAYRIVVAATNQADGNFFDHVLQILDTFLDVAYSLVYLLAIVFCSLTLFLNQIAKVRNHFYLSLLTFVGIPLFCVAFILVNGLIDSGIYHVTAIANLLVFSIIYLIFAGTQFLFFRKRVKSLAIGNAN